MKHITVVIIATILLLAASALAQAAETPPPGAKAAIELAVAQASSQAAQQALATLPAEVKTIGVIPLQNDEDGAATDALLHEIIQRTQGRAKVLSRDESALQTIQSEFLFAERNFVIDAMSEDQIRKMGKILGADAIVFGRVRERGLNDTSTGGVASVMVYLGIAETGQLAGSGMGSGAASIETASLLMALADRPWFWPVTGVGTVVALVAVVVSVPLRKRLTLAAATRRPHM